MLLQMKPHHKTHFFLFAYPTEATSRAEATEYIHILIYNKKSRQLTIADRCALVQGNSRSSTFIAIAAHIWLPISDCQLSSISHRFWDTASRSRKPPHPNWSPISRSPLRILLLSLAGKEIRHCVTLEWKLHGPNCSRFVTIHSRHRQTYRQKTYYDNSWSLHCNGRLKSNPPFCFFLN